MDNKLIGGILLIVGTSIGGGMLALPIATSQTGFIYSSFLLFGCWAIMTTSSFLILEVNLWLPTHSNLISMAKITLGGTGQIVAWICNLLLLNSVIAAYIAGGGDFLHHLLLLTGVSIPNSIAIFLFVVLLGFVVSQGIRSIDYVNRGLMITKFGSLIILIILILPFISLTKISAGEFKYFTISTTVAITSFSFANIIPSLRTYFHSDVKKLRLAILIGSLIPLICYILWDLAIMGTIPRTGADGLINMFQSKNSTSEFVVVLSNLLNREAITLFARTFTSVCLATSFLGASLCLWDFLADGLQTSNSPRGKITLSLATFLPPLLIVLFFPGIFITALSYAGIYCLILLLILPVLMTWRGRYHLQLAHGYRVSGGRLVLVILLVAGVAIITEDLTRVWLSKIGVLAMSDYSFSKYFNFPSTSFHSSASAGGAFL